MRFSYFTIKYGKRYPDMPYQGKVGMVLMTAKGKPFNILVEIDNKLVIIPRGNLKKLEDN